MHHVKLSAIPCFLIDTGCKCRKKLVSMTTTRLRRSTGAGCRMMLFQICDSRMISPSGGMEFKNQRTEEPKTKKERQNSLWFLVLWFLEFQSQVSLPCSSTRLRTTP